MADYISRRAAILAIRRRERENEKWVGYPETLDICTDLSDAIDAIKGVKPADVQPVAYGQYIIDDMGDARCSVCGETELDVTKNFCPGCGARLTREEG